MATNWLKLVLVLCFMGLSPAVRADVVVNEDGSIVTTDAPAPVSEPRTVAVRLSKDSIFLVPLRVVSGVQLYSPELGKGFPGLETVLAQRKTWRLGIGAAPILGTSEHVPFLSLSTRLSARFFDTGSNDLYFGAWVGKPSNVGHAIFGLNASTVLW